MTNDSWTAEQATRELMAVLPLLNRIVAAELRQEAGEDTTMPQFRVLSLLLEAPITVSAIAKKRRVSLQSAGELVQTLVERGWIERVPDLNDRRQFVLHLTEVGQAQHQKAQDRMLLRLVPFLEKLSEAEMAAVQVALPALHRVLVGEEKEQDSDGSN
ncbi:MAG: MarR family transcriptional regulator [Chloroflexota bacterium]